MNMTNPAPHLEEPGQRLRRARERLHLKYRDVEEASHVIATRRQNDGFLVGLSRLADIENKGTVPSIYRLYSLCAIYRLSFSDVLRWYGIELSQLPIDAAALTARNTHLVEFDSQEIPAEVPLTMSSSINPRQTAFLERHAQQWGTLPLALLNALNLRHQRYGFVGTDDWSMYPLIPPGSFVQVDETKRRILRDGWSTDQERPIYYVEHRNGNRCCWCSEQNGLLIMQAHSASQVPPEIVRYPSEADVIGQVVGVAMRLDQGKRRHTRF